MSLLIKKMVPNSRLLYFCRPGSELDRWQQGLERVEAILRSDPRLEEANPSLLFYFFAPSCQLREASSWVYWVGREVVGPVTSHNFAHRAEASICDLDGGECHQAALALKGGALSWREIFIEEERMRRKYAEEFSVEPALTWSLRLASERPEKVFLEFFGEEAEE